jgi:metal-responsive CopG/Arc/MetJ family transcriptional regulator
MMKTIQLTIDEALLAEVDDVVHELQSNRSAIMRDALQLALQQLRIRRLESQHMHGYQRQLAHPDDFATWEAEQVWGQL